MANLGMYETAMGTSFSQLAPAIQRFHRLSGAHDLHGWVETEGPTSIPARLVARLMGTPVEASSGPIHFQLHAGPEREVWTRHFPNQTMRSTFTLRGHTVQEHFGPLCFSFALLESHGTLVMQLQTLRFLGLACPRWLMPQLLAQESGEGAQLHFQVQATLPVIGLVARYRGHLVIPLAADSAAGGGLG